MSSLPSVAASGGLARYLEEIRRFPMLEPQQEYMLAKRWQEHEDAAAAQKLVTSHLRLVARIAMGYRGYGLPIGEVISEGNVGLMQAVKRFDPDKGFRLATYAMWWIRAAIQEYILRSWSLVKMGTTASQKKLFFNLRKAKSQLQALEEAGQSLGAGPLSTLFLVTLPLIWQGVLSGWLFAFIVSFGELNTALFLSGPGLTTLPIEIFSYLQFEGSQLVVAAASTIQIALIVLMVAVIERVVGMGRIIRSR